MRTQTTRHIQSPTRGPRHTATDTLQPGKATRTRNKQITVNKHSCNERDWPERDPTQLKQRNLTNATTQIW